MTPPAHISAVAPQVISREQPLAAHNGEPHEFGPVPIVAPSHGIGFRSVPRHASTTAETPLVADPDTTSDEKQDEPEPSPAQLRGSRVRLDAAVDDEPTTVTETAVTQATRRPGRHRREASALSGTVRSTRGRGLRGMHVAVLDEAWQVIATAVTGTGGAFIVEELPPGTYRVTAIDELDGDFGAAWHAGTSDSRAGVLRVKEGRTRRGADITLASTAAIKVDVDTKRSKADVAIRVTERATGVRAKGTVRVSTKRFSAELPLTKGRTALTLLGSADGSPRLGKKVKVDYLGSRHVLPGAASASLR